MRFFKYWSQGTADVQTPKGPWTVRCHGGSNTSVEDAARAAREIARSAAAAIERGESVHYGYGDRPLREEIVDDVGGAHDAAAVVTRNSYGSLILNTASVLFADIDYPDDTGGAAGGLLGRLFGRAKAADPDEQILARLHDVVESERGLGLRVYRTANGYRCLATNRTFDPTADATDALLERFGSDPLYRTLCRSQSCFRARLTAKHWRCGVPRPPASFPFSSDDRERRYRAWETTYHAKADRYAACAPVATFGAPDVHDAVTPILTLHDQLACLEGAALA